MKIFTRYLFALVLVFTVSIAAFADTIRLKDGSIIKGKITGFSGGKFVVTIGEGDRRRVLSFDASEVESVEFDAVADLGNRSASVPPAETSSRRNPTRVITTDTTGQPVRNPQVPVTRPTPSPTTSTPRVTSPTIPASTGSIRPIELNVNVLADNTANGWTNTGWVVKKGQRIKITGSGEVSLGNGRMSGASGLYDLEDNKKLMAAVPTGALIAVIGDDNNEFIYIGASREFTATRDGTLFLGINEDNLDDNSGTFIVKIEISPGS